MKLLFKLGILLAILLKSALGFAESNSQKIYETFEGKKGVFSLSFSKSVIEPFEIFLDDDTRKVVYKMKKIQFLAYNEDKGELFAGEVYERIRNNLDGGNYFEIEPEEINCRECDLEWDEHEKITLIGHGSRKNMDEFHIVIGDREDCILFSFLGEITIEELRGLGKFSRSTQNLISF